MNREDIIKLAREAQMPFYWVTGEIPYLDKLERFAALVAAFEREACAKVCESEGERIDASWMSCADAIRAKGQA